MDVHRAARIAAAGHGGQILLSQTTRDLVGNDLPPGSSLADLGQHWLKDLADPEHLYQLSVEGLPRAFAPLRSLTTLPNNLPSAVAPAAGPGGSQGTANASTTGDADRARGRR